MKSLKILVLALAFPLLAFTPPHKFYVSVTNINYSEKDHALQITTRIFIDDMEQLLKERYGIDPQLDTEEENKMADAYIQKYIKSRFSLKVDGADKDYTFLGKKYDNDIVICYIEVPKINIANVKEIEIQSRLLTDIYPEQQNVVNCKILDKRKSFMLIRDSDKGMLKL